MPSPLGPRNAGQSPAYAKSVIMQITPLQTMQNWVLWERFMIHNPRRCRHQTPPTLLARGELARTFHGPSSVGTTRWVVPRRPGAEPPVTIGAPINPPRPLPPLRGGDGRQRAVPTTTCCFHGRDNPLGCPRAARRETARHYRRQAFPLPTDFGRSVLRCVSVDGPSLN